MMQGYNNGNNFRGNVYGNDPYQPNTAWGSGYNTGGWAGNGSGTGNMYGPSQQRQQPQRIVDDRIYVTGRAGADAFPMPNGVDMIVLWDNDADRFYIKGYDNNGRPRVMADNDFQPHVDPEPPMPNIDLSNYATKEDVQSMIEQFVSSMQAQNARSTVPRNDRKPQKDVRSNEPNA